MTIEDDALIKAAIEVRRRAYCKYSGFAVGAAIESVAGETYLGCNVENASFGLTICAERSAACAAVAAGDVTWRRIALATETGATPCGACRQFLCEFAPDLDVIIVDASKMRVTERIVLSELLPNRFENF